eukprot:1138252-Pelagomonas_calceolata.AAC.3
MPITSGLQAQESESVPNLCAPKPLLSFVLASGPQHSPQHQEAMAAPLRSANTRRAASLPNCYGVRGYIAACRSAALVGGYSDRPSTPALNRIYLRFYYNASQPILAAHLGGYVLIVSLADQLLSFPQCGQGAWCEHCKCWQTLGLMPNKRTTKESTGPELSLNIVTRVSVKELNIV